MSAEKFRNITLLAAFLHDVTKFFGTRKHESANKYKRIGLYDLDAIEKDPDVEKNKYFIGAIAKDHGEAKKSKMTLKSIEEGLDSISAKYLSPLRRIVAISDLISARLEKAEAYTLKISVDYPIFSDPITGRQDYRKLYIIKKIDLENLKKDIEFLLNNRNRAFTYILETLLRGKGVKNLILFLKNFPNDTRFPNNDTSLLTHSITTTVVANSIYSMVSERDYKLSAIIFDHSFNEWLSRAGRTNEFTSKFFRVREFLCDLILNLSESLELQFNPLCTIVLPQPQSSNHISIVSPWIFLTCSSKKIEFLERIKDVVLDSLDKNDLQDVFSFKFLTTKDKVVNRSSDGVEDILKIIKGIFLDLKACDEVFFNGSTSFGLESSLKLCEYCGKRPGVQQNSRLICKRCLKVVERSKGVLIDDISDGDKRIAVIRIDIDLKKAIFDEYRVRFGNNIGGVKLEFNPSRLSERLIRLTTLGRDIEKRLARTVADNSEKKYHIKATCDCKFEGFVKIKCGDRIFSAIAEGHSLEVIGVPERNIQEFRIDEVNYVKASAKIISVSEVKKRVFRVVNKADIVNGNLLLVYLIPNDALVHAIVSIIEILESLKLDDIAKISFKSVKEDYPLYLLLREVLI